MHRSRDYGERWLLQGDDFRKIRVSSVSRMIVVLSDIDGDSDYVDRQATAGARFSIRQEELR